MMSKTGCQLPRRLGSSRFESGRWVKLRRRLETGIDHQGLAASVAGAKIRHTLDSTVPACLSTANVPPGAGTRENSDMRNISHSKLLRSKSKISVNFFLSFELSPNSPCHQSVCSPYSLQTRVEAPQRHHFQPRADNELADTEF